MSNLPHPYNYVLSNEFHYEFTTDYGKEYIAYFITMASYSRDFENVYSFSFEPRNPEGVRKHQDPRIASTVCEILRNIFSDNRNAVVVLCDTTDSRDVARDRLFKQWYNQFNENLILKIDNCYDYVDYNVYASLLIRKDNPNLDRIKEAFSKIAQNGMMPQEYESEHSYSA